MLYLAIFVPPGQPPLPYHIIHAPSLDHYVRDWGQRAGDCGTAVVEAERSARVGAAWLRLFPASEPGYGFVDALTPELSIAILPGNRGQGLGTRLIAALLQQIRGQYPAISLSVSRDNPAAAWYQRLGFQTVREDKSSWVMKKDIQP